MCEWKPTGLDDEPRLGGAGDTHLWLLALDQPPFPIEALAAVLDEAEHDRAARFRFPTDARRFRAAHGQMRLVLARYLGVRPQALQFTVGEAGKPVLSGAASGWHFNLSHSGAQALLGVTTAPAIGVDIEMVRSVPEWEAIAASHFAPAEQRALRALPPALMPDGFFACWTRKEAFVKALGGGLSHPLSDFEVSVDPVEPSALRTVRGSASEAARWTLWSARPGPGAWAAAAIEANPAHIRTFALRAS